MTKKPLFLDTSIKLQKVAMETQLSDNADSWQQEVASELYRQAPYVSNYAADVVLDKVDPERGYAYGKASLKNKYDMPQPQADQRAVSIPIIVKDRMLKPFDIYTMDNRSYPMSEQRVSQSLFRTQPLELTDRKPSDKQMGPQMQPPTRSHTNATVTTGGMGKFASSESLLDTILPTVSNKEKEDFFKKVSSDLGLRQAFHDNPAFASCIIKIATHKKEAGISGINVPPTAAQFTKISRDTFVVKVASPGAYEPVEHEVDTREVASIPNFLGENAYRMAPGERYNVAGEPAPVDYTSYMPPANTPGTYKVQDSSGVDRFGAVLPMTNFAGERNGDSLFVNTNSFSVQEKVAGVKISSEVDVQESLPSGYGVFYSPDTETVTEPMKINYSSPGQNGSYNHYGTDQMGGDVRIVKHPFVTKMAQIDSKSFAVPNDVKWISLPNEEISVRGDTSEIAKIAAGRNLHSTIEVRRSGDEYSFSGRPVDKLASSNKQFLDRGNAEFLMSVLGLGSDKLAELNKKFVAKFAGAKTIVPLAEVINDVKQDNIKQAAKFDWSLRRDLLKEAAFLQDEDTIDKVLSLGFLNPDNIKNFAGYLPELEKNTSKLADLLFASRCGLSSVPEEAIESAMRNTDQIITGLRSLNEQQTIPDSNT